MIPGVAAILLRLLSTPTRNVGAGFTAPISAQRIDREMVHQPVLPGRSGDVRFSNRPFGVKHFQAFHHRHSVDVARGLVLLYGIGTRALPSWDSRTRRNNLLGGLAVRRTAS